MVCIVLTIRQNSWMIQKRSICTPHTLYLEIYQHFFWFQPIKSESWRHVVELQATGDTDSVKFNFYSTICRTKSLISAMNATLNMIYIELLVNHWSLCDFLPCWIKCYYKFMPKMYASTLTHEYHSCVNIRMWKSAKYENTMNIGYRARNSISDIWVQHSSGWNDSYRW